MATAQGWTRGSWAGLGWAAGGRRGPKVGSSQGPCWEAQPKSKARSGSEWGWWAEVQRAKLLGRPWAGRSGTRAQARHAARAPRAEVSFQRRRVTDVLSRTNCDLPPGLALRAFPAKDKQDGEAGSAGALGARSGAAWGSGLPAQGVCPTWHPRRSQGSLRPFLGAGLVIWGAALAVKEAGRGRSGSVSNCGTKQSHGSFRRPWVAGPRAAPAFHGAPR